MKKLIFILLGVTCLAVAWIGPLPALARETFYGHMIMHMLVVAVAPSLLSLGIVGGQLDLARKYPSFFLAIPVSIVELIIVWGWHAPKLHHLARHTNWGMFLEQGTFFLSGFWMWLSALGGEKLKDEWERKMAGILGLLLTSMHMTFLGALLSFSEREFYSHLWGHKMLNGIEDQHLGGAIMLVIGGFSYLSGGIYLTYQVIQKKNQDSWGTVK